MYSCIFNLPGLYSALYTNSERRTLYSAIQVYIQHYIQTPDVDFYNRPSGSIIITVFSIRMYSSIFGYPVLYSALYSTSECRPLYSALNVYIQHYIQRLNVELYIRLSNSIFSTRFNIRMLSSIFGSQCLYSALYSNFECSAFYLAPHVYNQHYIQTLNVELYIRNSRTMFSTIFIILM